jgi:hypothetical protein
MERRVLRDSVSVGKPRAYSARSREKAAAKLTVKLTVITATPPVPVLVLLPV